MIDEKDLTDLRALADRQATELERLRGTLDEVLQHFTQKGHPGEPCVRTSWVQVYRVASWRRVLDGKPTADELLADVPGSATLSADQRALVRKAWAIREVYGSWDSLFGGRRVGYDQVLTALAEMVRLERLYLDGTS